MKNSSIFSLIMLILTISIPFKLIGALSSQNSTSGTGVNEYRVTQNIHVAAREMDIQKLERSIDIGENINAKDNRGFTALENVMLAVADKSSLIVNRSDDKKINSELDALYGKALVLVNLLLENGALANRNAGGQRALILLAKSRNLTASNNGKSIIIALLNAGLDINYYDSELGTALAIAAQKSDEKLARFFIEKNADAKIAFGPNKVHALLVTRNAKIAEMLIDGGADVNMTNDQGKSLLNIIAEETVNSEALAEILIDEGIDLGKYGPSALEAALKKDTDLAILLLKNNVKIQSKRKQLISDDPEKPVSVEKELYDAISKDDELELIELLIKMGFGQNLDPLILFHSYNAKVMRFLIDTYNLNPEVLNSLGQNLLHYIAGLGSSKSSVEDIDYLIEKGIDPKAKDMFGKTPLVYGLERLRMVKKLLEKAPTLAEAQDNNGNTLLHSCANQVISQKPIFGSDNCLIVIDYLVNNTNINPSLKNSSGQTAHDILTSVKIEDVLKKVYDIEKNEIREALEKAIELLKNKTTSTEKDIQKKTVQKSAFHKKAAQAAKRAMQRKRAARKQGQ